MGPYFRGSTLRGFTVHCMCIEKFGSSEYLVHVNTSLMPVCM